MVLQFTKNEINTIIMSLDFYSRIWMGQYDRILSEIRVYKNYYQLEDIEDIAKTILSNIRDILLPGLKKYGHCGSYGIFSSEIDFKAGVAYDMQQEFRYKLAYFEHPEGGLTVDFNKPIMSDLDPYDKPYAECYKFDDNTFVSVKICKEQLDIIKTALSVNDSKNKCNIVNMFSNYTKNSEVLSLADILTRLFSGVSDDVVTSEFEYNIMNKIDKYICSQNFADKC